MSTAGFLAACEAEHAKGNAWALAQVLDACALDGIPLPSWTAKAYSEGMEQVRRGKRDWTDGLGRALAKGQHADALERQERLLWTAHRIVTQLRRPAKSLRGEWDQYAAACTQLEQETGERISATTMKGYIREAKRRLKIVALAE